MSCRAEHWEVRNCPVQSEFFHSWTNTAVEPLPWGQDSLRSLNELLFLRLLCAVLVLAVAALYLLGDSRHEGNAIDAFHDPFSHSCDVQACAPQLRNPPAEVWEPQWSKEYWSYLTNWWKRAVSTHWEHSPWSLGPAFSSSVHWEKCDFKRWSSLSSLTGPGAYQCWKFRSRVPVTQANLSHTQGRITYEKSG